MPPPAVEALFERYDEIIQQMETTFDSHHFIHTLAQQNQGLYIRALYEYVNSEAPFRVLHGQLAKQLHEHSELELVDRNYRSDDIFDKQAPNALWRRQ